MINNNSSRLNQVVGRIHERAEHVHRDTNNAQGTDTRPCTGPPCVVASPCRPARTHSLVPAPAVCAYYYCTVHVRRPIAQFWKRDPAAQPAPPPKTRFGTGKYGHAWSSPDPPNPMCTPAPSVLRFKVVRRPTIARTQVLCGSSSPLPARVTLHRRLTADTSAKGGPNGRVLQRIGCILDCVFCGAFADSCIATTTAAIRRKTTTTMGTTYKNV